MAKDPIEDDDEKLDRAGDSGDPVIDGLWEMFDKGK